jgi:hypothetical protein
MTTSKTPTLGERLQHELREYLALAVYLYVCFGALLLYKSAILAGTGVSYAPFGLAVVKALVLGKFLLLGQAANLGNRHLRRSMAFMIVKKAVLFAGLLIGLSIVEEAVVALVHSEAVETSLVAHLGEKLPETLATCLVLLLVLIPYFAFQEIGRTLGDGTMAKHMFGRRTGAETDQR